MSKSRGKTMLLLALSNKSKGQYDINKEQEISSDTYREELQNNHIAVRDQELNLTDNENDDPFHNSDDEDKDPDFIPTQSGILSELVLTRDIDNPEPSSSKLSYEKRSNKSVYTVPSKRSRIIRETRKIKRNSGQAYVTENGKEIRGKYCHELAPCRLNCATKFEASKRQELFTAFWSMEDHDRQADYIISMITSKPKATTRTRTRTNTNNRNREYTFIYHLKINGELQKICKTCFVKTFDVTEGFIKVQLNKILHSPGGIATTDKRGRHSPITKTTQLKRNEVIHHINSFPKYESHYSRRHTEKKYLAHDLNLSKMYLLYTETTNSPVSQNIYRSIFKEMNIGFKMPHNYTCNTDEEKLNLQANWNNHKERADKHFEIKSKDKTEARKHNYIKMISFDLQQVLQTPYLQTSLMFYKRQLAVYNLTIHEGDTGVAYNFLWNETIAGRGANQIGSCLYRYIQEHLSADVSHLIMYSDTCTGQNRNSHIAAMCFSALYSSNTLQCIDHKFMISGHSHMECDTVHASIEKQKKKTAMDLHHPRDWSQLIRSMGNKFKVVDMNQENFLDFKKMYLNALHLKTKDDENNKFIWHDVQWMRFSKEETTCTMLFKTSLEDNETFKKISFVRRGQNEPNLIPSKQYSGPLPITKEKKVDLLSILYLGPVL